jgi:diguanylate cyclase (GGDEF)-like protein
MWALVIRSPSNAPVEYEVQPGKNTLGRKPDNNIIIADESASRSHAEIYCQNDMAILYDLGSTNGTFVNRERITKPHVLESGDQIRIGQHVISASFQDNGSTPHLVAALSGTRPLTRDLLLESIDQHAVFLDVVSSRLTVILNLDTALLEIADVTRMAVGAEKSGVILAEQFDHLEDLGLPEKIIRQAIEQRSVVIVPDVAAEYKQPQPDGSQHLIFSILCVPVIIEEAVVALIYAYKTNTTSRHFDQHDVQLAVAISHQAALTIQRAKLIKESQMFEQLAITDSLTGLHNRREILRLAEIEFERARRFKHPLSLLILDLDDLKQLNDSQGHLVGDCALKSVAENSRIHLREIDSFGRFGGDEFIILLIETGLEGGRAAAERIRKTITDSPVKTPQGTITIGVSIGIASNNDKISSVEEMINQADIALLKAKKAGKNQIAVAE